MLPLAASTNPKIRAGRLPPILRDGIQSYDLGPGIIFSFIGDMTGNTFAGNGVRDKNFFASAAPDTESAIGKLLYDYTIGHLEKKRPP